MDGPTTATSTASSTTAVVAVGGRRRQCVWATATNGIAQWELATRTLLRSISCSANQLLPPLLAAHCLLAPIAADSEPLLCVGNALGGSKVVGFIDKNGLVRTSIENAGASGGVSNSPVTSLLCVNGTLFVAHANGIVSCWQ